MKPLHRAKVFRLCRKHISMDLTETSEFVTGKSKCTYCKRKWAIDSYRRNHAKKQKTHDLYLNQIEMKNENIERKIIPEKIKKEKVKKIPFTREQKLDRKRELSKKYIENIDDCYIRNKIGQSTSLKKADIPQPLIDVYRQLLVFKRALKQRKNQL